MQVGSGGEDVDGSPGTPAQSMASLHLTFSWAKTSSKKEHKLCWHMQKNAPRSRTWFVLSRRVWVGVGWGVGVGGGGGQLGGQLSAGDVRCGTALAAQAWVDRIRAALGARRSARQPHVLLVVNPVAGRAGAGRGGVRHGTDRQRGFDLIHD